MNDFQLEKWYMDATDEEGRAFIGYSAKLRWRSVRLQYNGYTFLPGNSLRIVKRNSFSSSQFPIADNNTIEWKFLDAHASWKRIDAPVHETLLSQPIGDINWSCIFPKAYALVTIGNEQMKKALGYVEKISISIPPWKIPIRELHWGRFITDIHTVVWIKWEGPLPKTLIYHNNERIAEGSISSEIIIFGNYSLDLGNKQKIRSGTLFSTVFAGFKTLMSLFPNNIMHLQENKWVSDGNLKVNGKIVSSGKAIHEHVIWP